MHKVQELFFQCLPSFDTSHSKAMVMEVAVLGFSGNFFLKIFRWIFGLKISVGNLR